jgi:hypothetical protein
MSYEKDDIKIDVVYLAEDSVKWKYLTLATDSKYSQTETNRTYIVNDTDDSITIKITNRSNCVIKITPYFTDDISGKSQDEVMILERDEQKSTFPINFKYYDTPQVWEFYDENRKILFKFTFIPGWDF